MTKLECPHCNYTLSIQQWNENVKESVMVGVCDELIPEDLEPDQWQEYASIHGGRVDCPECEEVCSFDDMNAY